jgi:hypothetical protein
MKTTQISRVARGRLTVPTPHLTRAWLIAFRAAAIARMLYPWDAANAARAARTSPMTLSSVMTLPPVAAVLAGVQISGGFSPQEFDEEIGVLHFRPQH